MGRSLWRCRNRARPVPHGAVLARITGGGGLVLDPGVRSAGIFLDSRRAAVRCPRCGAVREFRGAAVLVAQDAEVG